MREVYCKGNNSNPRYRRRKMGEVFQTVRDSLAALRQVLQKEICIENDKDTSTFVVQV